MSSILDVIKSDAPVIELRGTLLAEFKAIMPREAGADINSSEVLYGYLTENGGRDWYSQPRE